MEVHRRSGARLGWFRARRDLERKDRCIQCERPLGAGQVVETKINLDPAEARSGGAQMTTGEEPKMKHIKKLSNNGPTRKVLAERRLWSRAACWAFEIEV